VTPDALPVPLRRALMQLARSPRLLVACDYDGTLAPIVQDPSRALPGQESVAALRALAQLSATTVAVISGRALRDLATLSRLPSEVHLVGSHGSEFDVGFVHDLAPQARQLHERLHTELSRITEGAPGTGLETKPASTAVHVRQAEPEVGERVLKAVRDGPCRWDGVQVTEGKAVIELAVVQTDKGQALDVLRHQVGASAAVFLGDDVTDEKAFARLHGPDLGIKVGPGDTLAGQRVDTTDGVARALAFLLEERRTWLHGEQAVPIERHSMLSNGRAVALLTPDARVSWLCHPEPDSGAVFADLLGGPTAGYFSVHPDRNGLPLGQRYAPGTMTVETRWSRLLVTDYLDHVTAPHRTDLIRVITGETTAVVEFAPRPEFGNVPVRLEREPGGLRVLGTSEPIVLRSAGVDWEITSDGSHESARALVAPGSGAVVLELRCGSDDLSAAAVPEPQRRETAGEHWSSWAAA
jgi:trehalose 6-phosphate phosphatase